MYKIVNFETKEIIETTENPKWVRMQSNGSECLCPECTIETADGIVLSDDSACLGIEGRNMQNYKPTVLVEEVPETIVKIDFMSGALDDVVKQVANIEVKVNTLYDAQTQGIVLQSELDAAYIQGVNTI